MIFTDIHHANYHDILHDNYMIFTMIITMVFNVLLTTMSTMLTTPYHCSMQLIWASSQLYGTLEGSVMT